MLKYIAKNEEETMELGRKLAGNLTAGSTVAVTGDLGAGKTIFVKGVAKGLSIHEHITSPTFTIIQSYKGDDLTLHHFDVYRIANEDELFETGFFEYLHSDDICVIEWADLVESLIPSDAIWVNIERYGNDTNKRSITIEGIDME
jgi:tRNA threonylcarbamoyladenosine biosynthesis protein TsaE